MLKLSHAGPEFERRQDGPGALAGEEYVDLDRIVASCKRQWHIAAIFTAGSLLAGLAYILLATPLYTASTDILIDRNSNKIADELTLVGSAIDNEVSILSQVEIIKSQKVGSAVVDRLGLMTNQDFAAQGGGMLAWLAKFVSAAPQLAPPREALSQERGNAEIMRRDTVDSIRRNLGVSRVGQTYVIQVNYTSASSRWAVDIANAYAEAYLGDQLDSKYDTNRRASAWLESRIDELRAKSLASDLAVQKFSAENGLITTGGELVSDQQLTELNTLLVQAQAETSKSQARYDRIRSILTSGQSDAIVTDALDSSVISSLRGNYMASSKREAEIAKSLGEDHEQAVRLRGEMAQYKRLMFEELARIAESYQSELKMAQSREGSLRLQVSSATGISKSASRTQVQLRELQREAETYRSLYQNFLQRYQEAHQQQSFPVADARVISRAMPPDAPSFPRKSLVLALALLLGAASGIAAGAIREFRDRSFRTAEQVRQQLGLKFIGYISEMPGGRGASVTGNTPASHRSAALKPICDYVARHPLSGFAETMRNAKAAIDQNAGGSAAIVVGIVSTLRGEGRSTVAVNLAQLLAIQGAPTLLIDADVRTMDLTRAIAPKARLGLIDAVADKTPLAEVLVTDAATGLSFLPAAGAQQRPGVAEIISSGAMAGLLNHARTMFDYVVIDLPPMAPLVDVHAIAPAVDAFLLTIEWGKTIRKITGYALESDHRIHEKCVGVVLNRADQKQLKYYQGAGSGEASYTDRPGQMHGSEGQLSSARRQISLLDRMKFRRGGTGRGKAAPEYVNQQ